MSTVEKTASQTTTRHHNCARSSANTLGRSVEPSEVVGLQRTLEKRRWTRFGLVGSRYRGGDIEQFWRFGRLYKRLSCMPIVPGRSRRDCGSLSGGRSSLGSLGMGGGGAVVLEADIVEFWLPSRVQLLEDWTHRIKIRPMQWHVHMMPPCHCIETFHEGVNTTSAIEHTRGKI